VDDYSTEHLLVRVPADCEQFRQRGVKLLVDSGNILQSRKKHFLRILLRETNQCVEGSKDNGYLLAPINFYNGIQVRLSIIMASVLGQVRLELIVIVFNNYEAFLNCLAMLPK
jgi:hypothetical protein